MMAVVKPYDWRSVKLEDILPQNAISEITEYLSRNDATIQGLYQILEKYRDELLRNGVYPKYLAYALWYSIKMKEGRERNKLNSVV